MVAVADDIHGVRVTRESCFCLHKFDGAVTYAVSGSGNTAGCSLTSASAPVVLDFTSGGACTVVASLAASSSYASVSPIPQTFTIEKLPQTVAFTSTAPTSPAVGDTYSPAATGGGSGNPVVFSIDSSSSSGCTYDSGTGLVTFSAPAGSCVIDADQAGNASYEQAPEVSQTITVGKLPQTVAFTSTAPTSPAVGDTYSPAATGGGSGNPVVFSIDSSSSSGCTYDSGTGLVTFSAPAGSCVIDADQAGNASYEQAPEVSQTITVGKLPQTVAFTSTAPTSPAVGDTYSPAATGGGSGNPVVFSIDSSSSSGCTYDSGTGLVTFSAPAGSCVIDADQAGNASYEQAPEVSQTITVGKLPQTVVFTSTAPTSPAVGDTYSPAATGGGSGNPVVFSIDSSSSSGCTYDSGTGLVTFSAPAGSCVIDADQAGNASYEQAPEVSQTITVGKLPQTVAFTSTAPTSPAVGDTYSPAATGGGSGNPVVFSIDSSSSSGCTYDSGTGLVTFSAPAGSCVIDADQAGNASYEQAPEVSQTITVGKLPQTVAFTSTAPTSPAVGDTYSPAATGGGSGNPVVFSIDSSSSSGCTYDSGTGLVTFSAPAGSCVIDADQAGNASYEQAPEVSQTITVGKLPQTVAFTSTAPTSPAVGDTYSPAATGGGSGNPVVFSIDSSSSSGCTYDSGTGLVTFSAPAGSCVIDADQAGNASYEQAPEVSQTITVGKLPQTVQFAGSKPNSTMAVGGTYRPAAKATSGLKVTYSIDPSSSSVCSIHDGVVTFLRPGRCTIVARQTGSSRYSAAHEVLKTIIVGKLPQTVAFTSTAPTSPAVGGTYRPAAKATSGLKVTYSIDPSSSSVCSIHDGVVIFLRPGRCTIVARQTGSSRYSAAHEVLKTSSSARSLRRSRSRARHRRALPLVAPTDQRPKRPQVSRSPTPSIRARRRCAPSTTALSSSSAPAGAPSSLARWAAPGTRPHMRS